MYFAVVSTPPASQPSSPTSDYGDTWPRIVRVRNDNGEGRQTTVPLRVDTTGQDLLDCVRDPGYTMVHLVARWHNTEILVLPTDDIGTLLRELEEEEEEEEEEGGCGGAGGGEGRGEVELVVRYEHTDSPEGFRLAAGDGRRSQQRRPHTTNEDTAGAQWPLSDLPDPAMAHMTLPDLQALAARQQVAMETQQQALVARETRLKYLQQREAGQQQLSCEEARLMGMKEKVEEQELKLRRLRALRGQVEHFRTHNGHLNTELETVRALFNQKEKELALAVSRVDSLMKQLQDLRNFKAKETVAHDNRVPGDRTALTMELEKLRKEVAQRSQVNTGYMSRLTAQQQRLQQRRDQVAEVDVRIQELQQRLKKRRLKQSPPPPPPPQPSQQSLSRPSQQSPSPPLPPPPPQQFQPERGGRWGWQAGEGGRKQNVAAVEPYIKHPPKDTSKDMHEENKQSKGELLKEPKSSPRPGTKMSAGGNVSQQHDSVPQPMDEEVNNNDNKCGGEIGQQAPEEYKIPTIVSSHFDAGKGVALSQKSGAEVGVTSVASSPAVSQSWNTQGPVWTSSKNPACIVTPPVNSFGKQGPLSKWPPSSGGGSKGGGEALAAPVQHPPHQPHINIFEEERQAGSGQSSPGSSEGSGPLSVNRGSEGFPRHSPPASSSGQSAPGTSTPATVPTLLPEGHIRGAQSAPPAEPRGQHAGRQAPKPPPRAPQTVLHSRAPVTTFSSSSTSFSSSSTPFSPSSTSFCSSSAPFSSSLTTASSADTVVCTASSGISQPVVVSSFSHPVVVSSLADSTEQGASRAALKNQDLSPNSHTFSGGVTNSGEQGNDGKAGTAIHLNQRPAPTYRYAPKNIITSAYTSRQGNSGTQHFQQWTKEPSNWANTEGKEHRAAESNPVSQNSTTGDNSSTSASDSPRSPTDRAIAGENGEGLTHFGVVGAPNYPDIASDKGSYKSNTPKQVRRRHSDSDSEELAKVLKRESRVQLEQLTEDTANSGNADSQLDSSVPPAVPAPGGTGSTPPSPVKAAPEETEHKTAAAIVRQRKAILKANKKGKSSMRVSFDPLALLLDASLEGELDLVKRTAEEVDNVSQANDEGITALHNAICAGHYHVVKFLVEFGADVNSPDSDGWTPLHCAASCNNLPMVRVLVEHGACVLATTLSDRETPAEKCEEDEDGYDHCSQYLYGVQEKLGIVNKGVVYAVFDYTAIRKDELSFHVNDKLTVTRKGDDEEREWWWASGPDSREGYIPRNLLGLYPRVLPPAISLQPLHSSHC